MDFSSQNKISNIFLGALFSRGSDILTLRSPTISPDTHGNNQFRKLEKTNEYIPDVLFECIIPPIGKQLNLLLEKEKRANDSICEIPGVTDSVFKGIFFQLGFTPCRAE